MLRSEVGELQPDAQRPSGESAVAGIDLDALEGAGDAREVAHAAGGLAERLGLGLVLLHVEPPPVLAASPHVVYAAPSLDVDLDTAPARRRLEKLAAAADLAVAAELRVELGDPASRLLAAAGSVRTGIVVLGSSGRTALRRALSASVGSTVVARAACPVLVIPHGATAAAPAAGPVVCGVDGSDESRAALRVAARLAAQLGAGLTVAHVAPVAGGEELAERIVLEEGLAGAARRALTGPPAEALAGLAEETDAELLVVGSRGRGAFRAALLGSVSDDLIRLARRPVLIVPPGAGRRSR